MLINGTKEAKVVGSTSETLQKQITKATCDIVELRLDGNYNRSAFDNFCTSLQHQILITARDIKEGGINDLHFDQRLKRLNEMLPHAAYIDVEMRNWEETSALINDAKTRDITTIASYHDFQQTPSETEIHSLIDTHRESGADIIKFAFMMHSLNDLATCQQILFSHPQLNLSIMGMGKYAPVARLLLAQSGSVLNYGYLGDEPTAPGQWPAHLLKKALLASDSISENIT